MDCYFQVKFLVANPFFATSYENIQVCGIFVGVVNNVSVLREAALQNGLRRIVTLRYDYVLCNGCAMFDLRATEYDTHNNYGAVHSVLYVIDSK